MFITTLIVGCLAAYWLGLRAGAWAAGVTLALCLVAVFVPPLEMPIYIALAIGIVAVCVVGARRERPADAVLAARWVRRGLDQVVALVRGRVAGRRPGRDDDDRA